MILTTTSIISRKYLRIILKKRKNSRNCKNWTNWKMYVERRMVFISKNKKQTSTFERRENSLLAVSEKLVFWSYAAFVAMVRYVLSQNNAKREIC